jgi:hypothetical protein
LPVTALRHFNEDINRARALLAHAETLASDTPEQALLRSDILRSAWMFAIGALDAYFCDAYTDLVAAAIIAKSRQAAVELPDSFLNIKFPVRAILEEYDKNENWRWRMAARDLMERENVLSFETIRKLFNKFCRNRHKFFQELVERWLDHPDARARLFGTTKSKYQKMTDKEKDQARKDAAAQMEDRFTDLFRRRHDCIHNCDRPRRRIQDLSVSGHVLKVIQDVEFLVNRCDEHITTEFREFLLGCKCTPATCSGVGY